MMPGVASEITELLDGDGDSDVAIEFGDPRVLDCLARQAFVTGALKHIMRGQVQVAPIASNRQKLWLGPWLVVAAALGVVVLIMHMMATQSLDAVMRADAATLAQPIDREFRLSMGSGEGVAVDRAAADRRGDSDREPARKIYMRGATQLVATVAATPLPIGTTGTDGLESWVVPPWEQMPVLVLERPVAVGRDGPEWLLLASLIQMRDAIATITRSHDLRLDDDAQKHDERIAIVATRRAGSDGSLPATMRIEVQRTTFELMHVYAHWSQGEMPLPNRHVAWDRLPNVRKTDDFYGHAHHHAPDRPVKRNAVLTIKGNRGLLLFRSQHSTR